MSGREVIAENGIYGVAEKGHDISAADHLPGIHLHNST